MALFELSTEEREAIWSHMMKIRPKDRPVGLSDRVMNRLHTPMVQNANRFWFDLAMHLTDDAHPLTKRTAEELQKADRSTYEHFESNFWMGVASIARQNHLIS